MTDEIDLDDLAVESDAEPDANKGDWFWRGDGDPEDEPDDDWVSSATADSDERDHDPVPHVPRQNQGGPVGIPKESGGAGGGTNGESSADRGDEGTTAEGTKTTQSASGPHGGGVDDMTMAITYEAARRLVNPRAVMADAAAWADWVGIVGDVEAYTINKFQRDAQIDTDFFSGSGQGPAERLADIDEHSMFFAERMVVVGVDGEAWIAEEADWEFVPLETAAEKADWELESS